MYIELVSKTSMWCGDKDVVMEIKASTYPQDPSALSPQDALNVRAAAKDIEVTISGLGEVSAHELDNPTWYGPRDLNSDEMGIVQQWLTSSGLLSEWREETARYISALSRVELSWTPIDVQRRGFLEYSLKLGGDDIAITVSVFVSHKVAVISTGLRTGDEGISLYDSTITGPVTTGTVKAAVCKSLDKLWDLVRLPLIED